MGNDAGFAGNADNAGNAGFAGNKKAMTVCHGFTYTKEKTQMSLVRFSSMAPILKRWILEDEESGNFSFWIASLRIFL